MPSLDYDHVGFALPPDFIPVTQWLRGQLPNKHDDLPKVLNDCRASLLRGAVPALFIASNGLQLEVPSYRWRDDGFWDQFSAFDGKGFWTPEYVDIEPGRSERGLVIVSPAPVTAVETGKMGSENWTEELKTLVSTSADPEMKNPRITKKSVKHLIEKQWTGKALKDTKLNAMASIILPPHRRAGGRHRDNL
jgi:hypothetical protein